ncbi:MAG TPA: Gfo/Idh/MocA family oxidoreductase [Acidobacteriota bacterium]|nr:Gfo/Idh/MocA family oxidoreductase [Acidobacteriota bacterium]
MKRTEVSRRNFLTAAAGVTIVPRHVLGGAGYKAPSDKLNIACIGVGGKGAVDAQGVASENIIALCDVDDERAAKTFQAFPAARRYRDFRIMLEKEKSIDAVTISTPDHVHAIATLMAMRLGMHVFCQKPLVHSLYEARLIGKASKKYRVATQMGIQGHCEEGVRRIRQWIKAGAIGRVREVQYWTNRPIWPQAIDRPTDTPETPATLDWDLWLGPAAQRPYHPAYHPFKWRGWWDFGTGALGDMACHGFDAAFWILDLGNPSRVVAETTPVKPETAPLVSRIEYDFPAKGDRPPVKLIWRDGDLKPSRPKWTPQGEPVPPVGHSGQLFIGDEGMIAADIYGGNPAIFPESRRKEVLANMADEKEPASPGIYKEWIAACKGGPTPGASFDYSVPLTMIVLLGNLAVRTGEVIEWDPVAFKVANCSSPNQYIRREYRRGWELPEV